MEMVDFEKAAPVWKFVPYTMSFPSRKEFYDKVIQWSDPEFVYDVEFYYETTFPDQLPAFVSETEDEAVIVMHCFFKTGDIPPGFAEHMKEFPGFSFNGDEWI
jgi:hypothetical protein